MNRMSKSSPRSSIASLPFGVGLGVLLLLTMVGVVNVRSAGTVPPLVDISPDPLYSKGGLKAKPTLTLALSVEFPTVGAQYVSSPGATEDATYSPSTEYIGYFDTESCYTYTNDSDAKLRRFDRSGAAVNRTCGGAGFSGNFMNWATSSAIDILRYGLTGGDRVVDTADLTVLQRAVLPNSSVSGNFWNGSNFPSKRLVAALAGGAVPTTLLGSHTGDVFVANCLNRVHFGTAKEGNCDGPGNNSNLGVTVGGATRGPVTSNPGPLPSGFVVCGGEGGTCSFSGILQVAYGANSSWNYMTAKDGTPCTNGVFSDPIVGTYKSCYTRPDPTGWSPGGTGGLTSDSFFYSRVSVCASDAAGKLTDPRTDRCLRYPNQKFKPVGNLQKYSDYVRVAAFGYLNDNAGNPNERYGGVLRAPMKFVGSKKYDANFTLLAGDNPQQEWDPTTGVFLQNPDGASGTTSGTDSNWPGQQISGVANYLNQFGRTGTLGQYKTYDPVSELYYEALRYLQGLPPTPAATSGMNATMMDGFPVYTTWDDPHPPVSGMTDYTCVKNNIVAIGDVNTHNDKSLPGNTRTGNESEYPGGRSFSVANNEPDFHDWTSQVGALEVSQGNNLADIAERNTGADGASFYIAGAAYWAHTQDIRGTTWSNVDRQRPGMRVTTYVLDVNEFGQQTDQPVHKNNQYFLAAKYGGFDDVTKTGDPFKTLNPDGSIASGTTDANWQKAVLPAGEARNYYLSSSARGVLSALDEIFANVVKGANSIAGAAISTQSLTTGGSTGYVYQAQFDPSNNWSGDVAQFQITSTGTGDSAQLGLVQTSDKVWSAAVRLDARDLSANPRKIFIGTSAANPSTPAMKFDWGSVDDTVKNALRLPAGAASAPYDLESVGTARLDFLRGDRSNEGSLFRRRGSRLGDIINSGIAYSGGPPKASPDSDYASFAGTNGTRPSALFVGANDGMLHAFSAADASELFAYIPSWLTSKLNYLTSTTYVHRSYVDATPVVAEAKVGSAWKTVLVGGTGGGGQGVYALDVSNPSTFDETKVMWEFTDQNDRSVGNVMGTPQILKFRVTPSSASPVYRYYAVVASGVNNYAADGFASSNGNPALFFLDLSKPKGTAWAEGTNFFKIEFPRTSTATAQGMINFAASAGNADEVAYIYAGDLQGNLWKLDFTTEGNGVTGGANGWTPEKLSFFKANPTTPVPMFVAADSSGNPQPISMKPALVYGSNRSTIVAFGTGKYLEGGDIVSPFKTQAVYALYDDNNATRALDAADVAIGGRARLKRSTASAGVVTASTPSFTWGRPTTDDDETVRAGWYFDFSTSGERQVSSFAVLGGYLVAGSIIPAGSACTDGSGNSYTLDVFGGNGTFAKTDVGILGQPLMVRLDSSDRQTTTGINNNRTVTSKIRYQRIDQGSGGTVSSGTNGVDTTQAARRLAWRQLNNSK